MPISVICTVPVSLSVLVLYLCRCKRLVWVLVVVSVSVSVLLLVMLFLLFFGGGGGARRGCGKHPTSSSRRVPCMPLPSCVSQSLGGKPLLRPSPVADKRSFLMPTTSGLGDSGVDGRFCRRMQGGNPRAAPETRGLEFM